MLNKIKALKKTEKGKALLKLLMYMFFLVIVIIILIIGNRTPMKKNDSIDSRESQYMEVTPSTLTYFEKQEKLYKQAYEFTYEITTADKKITFIGKHEPDKIEGIKETEDELIRYSIEEGKIYRLKLSSKEEYENLYEGLDEELFSLKDLFTKLNSIEMKVDLEENFKKYNYTEYNGYDITVTTNELEITNIYIIKDNTTYDFDFEY